jgi:predicted P-loop ATPase
LIGCIARTFQGAQNFMLVLDGPQGIGKSLFARWLAAGVPDEYFLEDKIDPGDKDTFKRAMRTWIWEVSELGATIRRADIEALKAFITMKQVTVRLPYARHDTQGLAMANFLGTINNVGGYLADASGNRRFVTVRLEEIDWRGYTQNCDPDSVWAEAFAAYLAGETWQLTTSEREAANQINQGYEVEDILEGHLYKWFDVDAMQDSWWLPTIEIVSALEDPGKAGLKLNSKAISMELSKTATRLGLRRVKRPNSRGKYVNGYTGIKPII